jgi:8-oxo-dGTP pyrophosphatase MutT (NUDIX family)
MYVRSVSILLPYNSKGEVLLQHRTPDASYYPNCWGFFGGGIEEGETPKEALKREAREELQLDLGGVKFFKRYEIKEEDGIRERFLYLIPTKMTLDQLKSQQREGDGIGFFTTEEVKKLKINPHIRFIFDEVKKYLKEKC